MKGRDPFARLSGALPFADDDCGSRFDGRGKREPDANMSLDASLLGKTADSCDDEVERKSGEWTMGTMLRAVLKTDPGLCESVSSRTTLTTLVPTPAHELLEVGWSDEDGDWAAD